MRKSLTTQKGLDKQTCYAHHLPYLHTHTHSLSPSHSVSINLKCDVVNLTFFELSFVVICSAQWTIINIFTHNINTHDSFIKRNGHSMSVCVCSYCAHFSTWNSLHIIIIFVLFLLLLLLLLLITVRSTPKTIHYWIYNWIEIEFCIGLTTQIHCHRSVECFEYYQRPIQLVAF